MIKHGTLVAIVVMSFVSVSASYAQQDAKAISQRIQEIKKRLDTFHRQAFDSSCSVESQLSLPIPEKMKVVEESPKTPESPADISEALEERKDVQVTLLFHDFSQARRNVSVQSQRVDNSKDDHENTQDEDNSRKTESTDKSKTSEMFDGSAVALRSDY